MSATLTPPKIEVVPHVVVTPPRFDTSRVVGEMTVEEWLRFLETVKERYEYIDGKVVELPGASYEHNGIEADCVFAFTLAIRQVKARCEVMTGNMKIYVRPRLYYFSDVSIVCGEPQIDFQQTLRNPVALVEVLSPTTEKEDRTTKFRDYQQIASLRHYLLIAQDRLAVTHYEKNDSGKWEIAGDYTQLTDAVSLTLDEKKVTIPLSEIYHRLAFTEDAARNDGA